MAEPYTPTTDEIVAGMTHLGDNFWRELTEAEVRRGLSAHDREVAARALREAADAVPLDCYDPRHHADWLRDRADQIEKGEDRG
ncbi:hypothetical protein EDD28_2430 [Salana multivorans]|uniref:Uncharacterized protein n=1 Tax=Salana multivorans TaxID=120377 RepID=A0A3N2DDF8_9MICO|nr:hypothetical protein [Salana multivorans]ROR97821.1 hypothetical protein EDD28_2430 [Salana multivorans]